MEQIAVFAPLLGFVIAFLFGKQIGDKGAQFVTCTLMVVAAICSCILFRDVALLSDPRTVSLFTWISSGDFTAEWALRVDQLTVVMMCVINIVSACVHIYSVGYMSHDPARARFMSYLSLFTFAMLMLVSADNLLQLFFGWEGVGLASYLLIGFWNHKPSANAAAVKAFVVNRVGDFGLILGICATFMVFGTIRFDGIFSQVAAHATENFVFLGFELHALTVICLLLFMGAVGKSAQLGLHTWLPDAMEGPTPVSALIHAATMVTAGVFLISRFSPVFEYAPVALMVVCVMGALTAIVAATIGMTQFDIKRVIAYSTMSQLGYMFFALGVSAYGAAMFHLVTHAFFKALLFLGAGSVIHAMSDEQDMRNMGGIWKLIPVTYGLMWIGGLALAGIPFFAGYYSKDIILEAAWADHSWFGTFAFWIGVTAAFMTAFYTWRLMILTFHGLPRAEDKVMAHVHESPAIMLAPLAVLAAGAIFAGAALYEPFVGGGHATKSHDDVAVVVEHEVEAPVVEDEHAETDLNRQSFWGMTLQVRPENDTVNAAHHVPLWVKLLPAVVGALGIGFAYVVYMLASGTSDRVARIFRPLHTLFYRKWYFDELYDAVFVRTSKALGRNLWTLGDKALIDGFGPDGVSRLSRVFSGWFSRLQSGYMYQYAFAMMIGVVLLISWFMFKFDLGMFSFGAGKP